MSTNLSYKDYFRKIVNDINQDIQDLISTQSLPLWINPVNSKFYTAVGYKVGDIVIAINDKSRVVDLLNPYIQQIADFINLDISELKEKNNWEIDDDFYDIILYGGHILPQLKIQPLTVMSSSTAGFDVYISTKGDIKSGLNYDMPGMSDAWLNLRSFQTTDSVNLALDDIIEKIEESTLLTQYYNAALSEHLKQQHFGITDINTIPTKEIELHKYINQLEEKFAARVNSANDTIRFPFVHPKAGIIGQTVLIKSTTAEYIVAASINIEKLDKTEPITMSFIPDSELNIVIPTVLEINGEYITGVNDLNNIDIDDDRLNVFTIESLYKIKSDSLIYKTRGSSSSYIPLSLSTTFNGFKNKDFIVLYTPVGTAARVDKVDIQCMPVEELNRTSTSITFKINQKYVWQTTALNIYVTGLKSDAS